MRKEKTTRCGMSYKKRQLALAEIGFKSYRDYLASDLWKSIRRKVFKLKGNLCVLCGVVATQIHHNRYHRRDLLGVKLKFLVPLCSACHEKVEFTDTEKHTVKQAASAFRRLRKATITKDRMAARVDVLPDDTGFANSLRSDPS